MENNLDNKFREGRQAADNQRREVERNPRIEETLDKLRVITEPFDISDLKYNNEVRISVRKCFVTVTDILFILSAKYL